MPNVRRFVLSLSYVVLGLAGCVQAGSLENPEDFRDLLASNPTGGMAGRAGTGGAGGGAGCAEACEIIEKRCATTGCHTGSAASAKLDLGGARNFGMHLGDKPATSAACKGELLIDTANPEDSLLYGKLIDPPACGARMPLGAPLMDTEIECIRRWLIGNPTCGSIPDAGGGMDAGTMDAGGSMDAGGTDTGTDAGPDPVADSVWIEAEDTATLTAPMATAADTDASGDTFISVPTSTALAVNADPSASTDGIATYSFSAAAAGTYRIWGRIRAASVDNDSFWVRIDTGTWYQWNNLPMSTAWTWDDVHDSLAMPANTVIDFDLTAGQHTLSIARREIGAELDKILITDDRMLTPTGEGQ